MNAHIYSFNDRSKALHEKYGLAFEGRLGRMGCINGGYHDELHYGMTKEEFEAADSKVNI